jgi:hypothetical protein
MLFGRIKYVMGLIFSNKGSPILIQVTTALVEESGAVPDAKTNQKLTIFGKLLIFYMLIIMSTRTSFWL